MLTDFFHKKYYPDLTREQVDAAINKDDNTYNKALEVLRKNHYEDLDIEEIKTKVGERKPLVNWFSRTKEYEFKPVLDNKGNEIIDRKTGKPLMETIETVTAPDSILSKGFEKKITTAEKRKNAKYLNIPQEVINKSANTYIETSNENQDIFVDAKDKNSLKSSSYEFGKEFFPKSYESFYANPNIKYQERTFDSGSDRALLTALNMGYYGKRGNLFGIAGGEVGIAGITKTDNNPKQGEEKTQSGVNLGISPNLTLGYNYLNKDGYEGSIRTNIGLDKRELEIRQNLGLIGLGATIGQNQSFFGDNWGASNENINPYTKIRANFLLQNIKNAYDDANQAKIIKTRTVDKRYNEDKDKPKLRNVRNL